MLSLSKYETIASPEDAKHQQEKHPTLCGVTNATQFQALPRPQQKHILYTLHELGAGPRTLSRLTGVSYSVVWRSTKGAKEAPQPPSPYCVCESDPFDEEFYTYCDEGYFQQYPEY